MSSHLRLQSSLEEPIAAHATYNSILSPRPSKKARMSLTQTYYVASTARSKLGREAGRADHNLRLLVGHANLLDQLMIELADAERESENWLNQSIREASKPEEPRHIQWMDTIAEDLEEEEDSDDEEEEFTHASLFSSRTPSIKSAPVLLADEESDYDSEDDAEFDENEDDSDLALQRVASQHSPPELTLDDSDSESEEEEDDYTPKSPNDAILELDQKEEAYFDHLKSQRGMEEDYVLRQAQQQPLIAAC